MKTKKGKLMKMKNLIYMMSHPMQLTNNILKKLKQSVIKIKKIMLIIYKIHVKNIILLVSKT